MGISLPNLNSLIPGSESVLQCRSRNHRRNFLSSSSPLPVLFLLRKKRGVVMHMRERGRAPTVNGMALPVVAEPSINEGVDQKKLQAGGHVAVKVKATAMVIVRKKFMERIKDMMLHNSSSSSSTQRGVFLQLVSTQLHPKTLESRLSNETMLDWSKTTLETTIDNNITYRVEFMVDLDFGIPGAITVCNKYQDEFFLESIIFEGFVCFSCNSWVQSHRTNNNKRIFFANKAYLPCQTPEGLKELREKELMEIRGDGEGVRIASDRIYDYDTYNDLGDPDKGTEYERPTLGGAQNPHPRRCRTGRPPTKNDVEAESREDGGRSIYVPRDELLGESKQEALDADKLKGVVRNIIPFLKSTLSPHQDDAIKAFSFITYLYKDRRRSLPKTSKSLQDDQLPLLDKLSLLGKFQDPIEEIFKFDPPKVISGDTLCCLRDDELGRQAVAGINPLSIERLEVFPPISKLDPAIYGPRESAIKEEHIIDHLDGMSVQQAMNENKLFILDYHDIYLPFANRINALDGRKTYGTRTLFFLTRAGTLNPIAIELSLPPADPINGMKMKKQQQQVLSPSVDATSHWLWQFGKAHVCCNDAGVHQLIHHWLRTHACTEPFIIAAHRQLSEMHPLFKLLHPHMRCTLKINAMARETLINAAGTIESFFTPGKHCMEMSCAAYRDWWRFDMEPLPKDLIRRGMAVADPTEPHGLRLLIEDYPYANDGLLIWSAIEGLVQTYVNHYYPDVDTVESDSELQSWYTESRTLGHADLRHASWWPPLSCPDDLVSILTTIIWTVSGQHAALNFGQYTYGGFIPKRTPLMRRLVPQEQDPDYVSFINDPQGYFLSSLPSLFEATKFMTTIEIISAHSPDEEYLGEREDLSAWSSEPDIVQAFHRFSVEIRRVEKEIEKRNSDPSRRNRCGAGISPYKLLIPTSGPGVTSEGVPNSITL